MNELYSAGEDRVQRQARRNFAPASLGHRAARWRHGIVLAIAECEGKRKTRGFGREVLRRMKKHFGVSTATSSWLLGLLDLRLRGLF